MHCGQSRLAASPIGESQYAQGVLLSPAVGFESSVSAFLIISRPESRNLRCSFLEINSNSLVTTKSETSEKDAGKFAFVQIEAKEFRRI